MSVRFDTIVVPVDFSETSDQAWKVACGLAALAGSHVHLVHVSPDPLRQQWTVEGIGVDFTAISQEWRAQSEVRLQRLEPTPHIPADRLTRVVLVGAPHTAIVEYATAQNADAIVIGTHGYGPIKHLLLGSVAERVVRQASCVVVTVPLRAATRGDATDDIATPS